MMPRRLVKKNGTASSYLIEQIRSQRDLEWSRALGITDRVLNPEQAKEWIDRDRQTRAHTVADARPRRGPSWS